MTFNELIKGKEMYVGSSGRNDDAISKSELTLGTNFSKEYRDYLKEIGLASFEGTELTGVCESKRLDVTAVTLKYREECENVPRDMYIVEKMGIDNMMVWQSTSGEVFISNYDYQFHKVADSLFQYYS